MAGIDRDYWLDFAKEGVSKSIENREKAADKLDTFLGWTWLVYTSIFALGSLLNFVSSDIWQLIWLAQPILLIMLARYFCAVVSMPSSNNDDKVSADPNDVASIIDSFKLIVEDKKKKLQTAKVFTFISIFSITAALVGYNYCAPDKIIKQQIQTSKLKKDLSNQEVVKPKQQTSINDSIKAVNDFYDYQIQNVIKIRKLNCVKRGDKKCMDTLKLIDK
jgi:hypothetical protein